MYNIRHQKVLFQIFSPNSPLFPNPLLYRGPYLDKKEKLYLPLSVPAEN